MIDNLNQGEAEPSPLQTPSLILSPFDPGEPQNKKAILVTNSLTPKAIGDGIAAVPALVSHAKWAIDCGNFSAVVWSCPQMPYLFDLGFPQLTPAEARESKTRCLVVLDTQEVVRWRLTAEKSLVELYADALGETLTRPFIWPPAASTPCNYLIPRLAGNPYAILSPFSNSDNSTLTKTWPTKKWIELAGFLRETGLEPVLLCTLEDDSDVYERICPFRVKGRPISEAVWAMQNAALVVTVDNGIGWLAQALSVPHIQILSSNMSPSFSFDFGGRAQNVSHCGSASALKVWEAVKRLREQIGV